jgi:hypothetical protein
MIESISYTDSGKPNLKLVSKEFAHRELRRMLGGDREQDQRVGNTFSNYTDAELFAELGRLANELGITTTLKIEPNAEPEKPLDATCVRHVPTAGRGSIPGRMKKPHIRQ